jgi:stage II sporulation protein AA (anti-sigma F factor antagonist)
MTSSSARTNKLRWILSVERHLEADVPVVVAAGRMSSEHSPKLVAALSAEVNSGADRVIVDLTAVEYVSSAGLMALDAAAGRMARSGGTLVLCGLTDPVRLVFELAGLLPRFVVAADRAAAHEWIRRASG